MTVQVRVSAVLTNGPFMLNLDCDHYINKTKALREAMCFLTDPNLGKYVCYVRFPQRFDGIDRKDRYANRNTVFFDISFRGLDGIQGPVYVGTGCVFNRTALYGYEPPIKPKHKKAGFLSSCFGGSRKKSSKSSKKGSDKKKSSKNVDPTLPIFNLEDIEEGVEGVSYAHRWTNQDKGSTPIFAIIKFLAKVQQTDSRLGCWSDWSRNPPFRNSPH